MTSTGATLEKRSLGQTGIQVTPVGLGMMEFSGGGGGMLSRMFPVLAQADKNAIVKTALDLGINWFDTAEVYGNGASEQATAAALRAAGKAPGDVVVATKWFPLLRTAGNIRTNVEERLSCLAPYPIDLYMVHQPFGLSSPEAEMDVMAELVAAGKIRSVGVSNFSAARMRRAHAELQRRGLPLAVNQVHYSLLHREIETNGILETAKELGVTIVAYTPLESGLLSGKYHQDPSRLQHKPFVRRAMFARRIELSRGVVNGLTEIGSRYNATPAQVALNWLIHFNGTTVVTIPGATKLYQAQEAAHAMYFRLSDQELQWLDNASRIFR